MAAFLPFSFFLAYGVMSIPSGFLVEYLGEKKVMILAFLISSIGALAFSINPSYSLYILSLFLIGSGMAMLQVSINPLLRNIGGEKEFASKKVRLISVDNVILANFKTLNNHKLFFVKTVTRYKKESILYKYTLSI